MYPIQDTILSPLEALQLAGAMVAVARVDGLNPAEEVLIRQFYDNVRTDGMPTTSELIARASVEASRHDDAAFGLQGSSLEFAETLVMMCFMAGYADGRLSEDESALIARIARAAGMGDAAFAACRAKVQDALVGSLAHLPDSGSVVKVFGQL